MTIATIEPVSDLRAVAEQSHAWPFEEARKIVARLKRNPKQEVIFETGYGPSGLPHIGTFGEVARTTMVRHAFRVLTDDKIKTRLIAFSDDMDALRKVPDNIPNKEMIAQHLGRPLTKIPDPFGTHDSFAAHNNARLRAFLDQFGFDYEFLSSTACYTSGRFDASLLKVLERFEAVMNIMLPSLREERAETYSPFLPISPRTGLVLQVPVVGHDAKAGTITYDDPDTAERVTTLVTGGRCKLQWKPDWAMRWVALGVDYEMAGKDLIDSVKLSSEICRALGGSPPEGFNYELFLDENGQKISKSKGNGLTIDEWLRYASPESLSLFMYREPKAAKRLYFDVIPRHVDEYQQFLEAYERQAPKERLANPVWHIHSGAPPQADNPVTFAMLLSLVTASNAENADTLWGFIGRYRPGVNKQTHPHLAALVDYAIHYFRDFVLPAKKFREPGPGERAALMDLRDALSQLPPDTSAETIQNVVYEVGRREPFLDQKKKARDGKPGVTLDWFNMLYQVLLGQEKGPRFGSFVAAYGIQNTIDMIDGALARSASHTDTLPGQLTPEMIRQITEFANRLVWKKPDLDVLRPEFAGQYPPIAQAMQQQLKLSDWRKKLVLPDLRAFNNESVAIFSDYGGENKEAKYLTYSTLICGWNLTHQFLQLMQVVRQRHHLGTKEIAFKDFRMGQVLRSLPDYLAALDVVPGFLFTLAVDKRLTTIFGPQSKETREFIARALDQTGLGQRKREVNEKLLCVIHVAAFCTGLLAHDGQKIFWMTDNDAISPTREMHEKTLALFQRVLGVYARQGFTFPLLGGALPFEERSLEMLDLLSATDIVAGSLDQYLTRRDSVAPEDILVKQGCDLVLRWLAHDGVGLKKMSVIMRPGQNGTIESATLEFGLQDPPQDWTLIPVTV